MFQMWLVLAGSVPARGQGEDRNIKLGAGVPAAPGHVGLLAGVLHDQLID